MPDVARPAESLQPMNTGRQNQTEPERLTAGAAAGPALVYIAGYGRSGSTLLDTLLNSHPQIFGAGELFFLFQNLLENKNCSCGMDMQSCSFWTEVLCRVDDCVTRFDPREAQRVTRSAEKMFGSAQELDRYHTLWTAVFRLMPRAEASELITLLSTIVNM